LSAFAFMLKLRNIVLCCYYCFEVIFKIVWCWMKRLPNGTIVLADSIGNNLSYVIYCIIF
ncbi:hypothetical protein T12_11361, partial [Trichinella patagoniensis]